MSNPTVPSLPSSTYSMYIHLRIAQIFRHRHTFRIDFVSNDTGEEVCRWQVPPVQCPRPTASCPPPPIRGISPCWKLISWLALPNWKTFEVKKFSFTASSWYGFFLDTEYIPTLVITSLFTILRKWSNCRIPSHGAFYSKGVLIIIIIIIIIIYFLPLQYL